MFPATGSDTFAAKSTANRIELAPRRACCRRPDACPQCGQQAAKKWDKYPDQTRYKCGSTTMMLTEDFHIDNHDPREEALYKQHLARAGRTMGDPML